MSLLAQVVVEFGVCGCVKKFYSADLYSSTILMLQSKKYLLVIEVFLRT